MPGQLAEALRELREVRDELGKGDDGKGGGKGGMGGGKGGKGGGEMSRPRDPMLEKLTRLLQLRNATIADLVSQRNAANSRTRRLEQMGAQSEAAAKQAEERHASELAALRRELDDARREVGRCVTS